MKPPQRLGRPARASLPGALVVGALAACAPAGARQTLPCKPGHWLAELSVPGGALRFGLELRVVDDRLAAALVNGAERIEVPRVEVRGDVVELALAHYDSTLTATLASDGSRLVNGRWRVHRAGADAWAELPFAAQHREAAGVTPAEPPPPSSVAFWSGRWATDFADDEDPSVGVFEVDADGTARGTFLTTTGDYRFLAGQLSPDGDRLELSCFDGAHAFLFRARRAASAASQAVEGEFWSGNWFHDTWTGVRDDHAALPDALELTRWTGGSLSDLRFPDLDGTVRALDDPAFAGRARLVELFGSWCPNCGDATEYLAELQRRYAGQGLAIVGLAFEYTGDFERDARQVRRYAEHHGVTWPLLVAGLSQKAEAAKVLPVLDGVRSFPTTIFLHGDGRVRAVYQGFSGPATGAEHTRLRATFEGLIEELLAEPAPGASDG